MLITHKSGNEWLIQSSIVMNDDDAAAIQFRATPNQVTMGAYVQVEDPKGIRIGHVSKAEYVERWDGPSYVTVSIALR